MDCGWAHERQPDGVEGVDHRMGCEACHSTRTHASDVAEAIEPASQASQCICVTTYWWCLLSSTSEQNTCRPC